MSILCHTADSAAGDHCPTKALKHCFSDEEWEQLLTHDDFVAALLDIEDMDRVEYLVGMGLEILQGEWWEGLKETCPV
jgi:hypothetical protein